jgi:asparagine synthase (glutamine-hydrolysing)
LMRFNENEPKTIKYWQISPRPVLKRSSDSEYAEALRALLFDISVEYTPPKRVGVTLSGGMDSTSVAGAIRAAAPGADLIAFSQVATELPEADETYYASAVCKHLNIPMVAIRIDQHWPLRGVGIHTSRATPFYNYYTDYWDETFHVVQANQVDLLFTGMGGDFLFGGDVSGYADLLLTGHWLELIRQLREHLPRSQIGLAKIIRRMILRPIKNTYLPARRNAIPPPEPWFGKQFLPLYQEYFLNQKKLPLMLPGRLQRYKSFIMPFISQIVELVNLQASQYGIELRHPLQDRRLIEFVLGLPSTQFVRKALRKTILRNAMQGYLPEEVLTLRDKSFTPETIFFRGVIEREQNRVWDYLTNMRAAEKGFVDEKLLQNAFRDYAAGKHRNTYFWFAITLEDWLRRYF